MSWPELYGFSLGGDSPVVVVFVAENSQAQKAGLLPGDQIIKVGDVNVQTYTKKDVIYLAKNLVLSPVISVISRLRVIELNRNDGYGLHFKGHGPVYISSVQKNSPAFHLGVHPGDIVMEINGICVSKASKNTVDDIVASNSSKVHLVLIAGAVNLGKGLQSPEPIYCFNKAVNYYLAGEDDKKKRLYHLLKVYKKQNDVSALSTAVLELFSTSLQRRLLSFIRLFLPPAHQSIFDAVVGYEDCARNKKLLHIQRRGHHDSLGLVLRKTCPVSVNSVVVGSVADASGLVAGDKLLEIHGTNVSSFSSGEVIRLMKNCSSRFSILVDTTMRNQSQYYSRFQSLDGKDLKMGSEFKEQVMLRLTPGEQLVMKHLLLDYLNNGDMKQLFSSLEVVLDDPYKLQLLHYLAQILPEEMQQTFQQYSIVLMEKQFENYHECCWSDSLKIHQSPHCEKQKDSCVEVRACELVNEKDIGNIKKGSTLDILLSFDDNTLSKLKKDVVPLSFKNSESRNGKIEDESDITFEKMVVTTAQVHFSDSLEKKMEKAAVFHDNSMSHVSGTNLSTTYLSPLKIKKDVDEVKSIPLDGEDSSRHRMSPTVSAGEATETSSIPPPPPPPPLMPATKSSGSRSTRNAMQLKRLNWEKITGKNLKNTVWEEIGGQSANEIMNFSQIEELFLNKPLKPVEIQSNKSNQIMSAKKSHNLGILMGHLKLPIKSIYDAVLYMDFSVLLPTHVRTLLTCAPDKKETSLLKKTEKIQLSNVADEFTKQMLTVPNYEKRLEIMHFKFEFNDKVKELELDITSVRQACEQLQQSRNLRHILEIVLATGNYMNKSYNSVCGASAFKIGFLTQLLTTKTSDNQSNLLRVVINTLLLHKPDVLYIQQELQSIPRAAKVSSQLIKQEINELKRGMKELDDELRLAKLRNDHQNDKFTRVMGQFVNEAHHSFHELLTQYTQMQSDFQQLVEFFGEEYTKTTTEDFFGSFAIFLRHIENTKEVLTNAQKTDRTVKVSRDRISISYPVKDRIGDHKKRRSSLPVVIDQTEKERNYNLSKLKYFTPTKIDIPEKMEVNTQLTLHEIAAKLSSLPQKGTLSGGSNSKSAPPLVVDAWEVAVDIDTDHAAPILKSDADVVSHKPWTRSPDSSPKIHRKLRYDENKVDKLARIKRLANYKSAPANDIKLPVSSSIVVTNTYEEDAEKFFPTSTQNWRGLNDFPLLPLGQSRHSFPQSPPEEVSQIQSNSVKSLTSERLPSSNEEREAVISKQKTPDQIVDKVFDVREKSNGHSLPAEEKDPPSRIQHVTHSNGVPTEENAYNAAIRASRSPQMAPKYLNLVKAKLEEEKKKAERPKLRRKITKHEKPLYARVMKETLQEYEQQCESKSENSSPTLHRRMNSPNFLAIMQQKLKEKAPSVSGDLDDVSKRKKSATEPLYASAIRETLQNYEAKKKEYDRVRKLGVSAGTGLDITDTEAGRRTPNFLSLLQDNLLEKNLINNDNEDEINMSLCDDEPLYALVIKAAITEYNNQNKLPSNDFASPESQLSPVSTSSTCSSNSVKLTNHYDGDHSRSSSDISIASEEVSRINQRFFKSAGKEMNAAETASDLKYDRKGVKPALPSIPSPDYTPHASDVDGYCNASDNRIAQEEHFVFQPHVERPFWGTDNSEINQSSVSSDSSAPSSPNKECTKKPSRSSLRKKKTVSKTNSVSFVKQVEVIDEIMEVDEDEVMLKNKRTESQLTGSPQIYPECVNTARVKHVLSEGIDEAANADTISPVLELVPPGCPPPSLQTSSGPQPTVMNDNIDIVFNLVTTTYPEGKMSMRVIPKGDTPLCIETPEIFIGSNGGSETPPEIDRSVKPKKENNQQMGNQRKKQDVDIRLGKTKLLRTIIPSPDYSPQPSPECHRKDTVPYDTKRETDDQNCTSQPFRVSPVLKQVIQVKQMANISPCFVEPVEKSLIHVFTEQYTVSQPSSTSSYEPETEQQSFAVLPRRSPIHIGSALSCRNTSVLSSDESDRSENAESIPPPPDRSKKPAKKSMSPAGTGPPPTLPRSPAALGNEKKQIIARFQAVVIPALKN